MRSALVFRFALFDVRGMKWLLHWAAMRSLKDKALARIVCPRFVMGGIE
jgi:hypothetical protein